MGLMMSQLCHHQAVALLGDSVYLGPTYNGSGDVPVWVCGVPGSCCSLGEGCGCACDLPLAGWPWPVDVVAGGCIIQDCAALVPW